MRRLFLLLLLAAPAAAARLETSVEPREARVGDRVVLTVTMVPGPKETPVPFEPPADLGPFALVAHTSSGTVHTLTLAVFEVDAATIPALTFRYLDAKGRAHSVETPEIPVQVKSVLPPGARDIKGLKGKLRALPPSPWWLLAAALAGAGIAAAVLYKKKPALFGAAAPPAVPPDEEALRALDELESLLDAPAKAYYSRLTDLWRLYIERRFGLSALDRTTSEMIPLLKQLPIPAEDRVPFRELLETADLAKFARFESPADERRRHRDRVRDFVLATRPRPAEKEEAPA
jgi:hypothetical protein